MIESSDFHYSSNSMYYSISVFIFQTFKMADNQDPSTRQQLIITADPGIDDAKAILMALSHPRWHVLAIFTHYGSSNVESTTSNCQKFLAALQRFDVS